MRYVHENKKYIDNKIDTLYCQHCEVSQFRKDQIRNLLALIILRKRYTGVLEDVCDVR